MRTYAWKIFAQLTCENFWKKNKKNKKGKVKKVRRLPRLFDNCYEQQQFAVQTKEKKKNFFSLIKRKIRPEGGRKKFNGKKQNSLTWFFS